MGLVPMELESSFLSRGYPHYTTAVYIYCDECGSFSIEKCQSVRQWLLLMGSSLLIVATIATNSSANLFLVFFIVLTIVMFTARVWGSPDYICRKCASATTTRYNTRDYPSDVGIVDVSEQLVQKYYLSYWPDLCDLDDYLKPPGHLQRTEKVQPKDDLAVDSAVQIEKGQVARYRITPRIITRRYIL